MYICVYIILYMIVYIFIYSTQIHIIYYHLISIIERERDKKKRDGWNALSATQQSSTNPQWRPNCEKRKHQQRTWPSFDLRTCNWDLCLHVHQMQILGFAQREVPQNGWFITYKGKSNECFRGTPISGNPHINIRGYPQRW